MKLNERSAPLCCASRAARGPWAYTLSTNTGRLNTRIPWAMRRPLVHVTELALYKRRPPNPRLARPSRPRRMKGRRTTDRRPPLPKRPRAAESTSKSLMAKTRSRPCLRASGCKPCAKLKPPRGPPTRGVAGPPPSKRPSTCVRSATKYPSLSGAPCGSSILNSVARIGETF